MDRKLLRLLQRLLREGLRYARRSRSASPVLIAVLTVAVFGISQWLREPPAAGTFSRGTELSCTVSKVADGDTVTARCPQGQVKVRLYGIDAPEMRQSPWGAQARAGLQRLLPLSAPVRFEVMDTDRYGRTVAKIYNSTQDLGLALVRDGLVVVYERYNDSAQYRQAQAQAQRERRGVWSQPGAQQTPWEWRKLNPR